MKTQLNPSNFLDLIVTPAARPAVLKLRLHELQRLVGLAINFDHHGQSLLVDVNEVGGFKLSVSYPGLPRDPKQFSYWDLVEFDRHEMLGILGTIFSVLAAVGRGYGPIYTREVLVIAEVLKVVPVV